MRELIERLREVAEPGTREAEMVVLETDEAGKPTIWCDPEIADLVQALNAGGIPTVASCSGHGFRPGSIALADGRWLVIAKDDDERRKIDALFPVDINGSAHPEAQAGGDMTDSELLTEFVRICREHKPVGQWPGERVCKAIERLLNPAPKDRFFIAPEDKAPLRGHNGRGGDADPVYSGPRTTPPPSVVPEAALQRLATPKPDTVADETGIEFFAVPEGLHPNTTNLVARFATALAEKLAAAEQKYGYSDNWARPDWMDECRQKLVEHTAKGDPRDVAAYCAFLWHHGESTAGAKPDAVAGLVNELQVVAEHIHAAYPAQKVKRLRRLVATLAAALGHGDVDNG